MILANKRYVHSGLMLSNEKYNFKSLDTSKRSTVYYSDLFMRFDLSFTFYSDSSLIAFSMVSLQSFFVGTSCLNKNSRRVFIKCKLYARKFYAMLPFFFFSYFQTHIKSRVYFFWPSITHFTSNRSIGLMYSSVSVYNTGFFDDYFFGVVDADSMYSIDVSSQLGNKYNDVIFCRLFSSFLCVPYIYKNINDL